MSSDTDINGALLRLKREEMGWTLADMAARACLSTKQVKQLEEGGDSAFYSLAIKLTVAKKNAHILGLSEDELFGRNLVNEETLELSSQTQTLAQDAIVQPELEQQMLSPNTSAIESRVEVPQETLSTSAILEAPQAQTQSVTKTVELSSKPTSEPIEPDPIQAVVPAPKVTETQLQAQAIETTHASSEAEATPTFKKPSQTHLSEQSSSVPLALSMPSNESPLSDARDSSGSMGFGVKLLLFLLVIFGVIVIVQPRAKDDVLDFFKGSASSTSPAPASESETVPTPMIEGVPKAEVSPDEVKASNGNSSSAVPITSGEGSANTSLKTNSSIVNPGSSTKPDANSAATSPDNVSAPSVKPSTIKAPTNNTPPSTSNLTPNNSPSSTSSPQLAPSTKE